MRSLREIQCRALPLLFLLAAPALAAEHIGDIEFFGYKGLDVAKIRAALPVHEGDEFTSDTKRLVRQAVRQALGKPVTEVGVICCDEKGLPLIFIGLPGESSKSFSYNPAPTRNERLGPDIVKLSAQLDEALEAAVHKGGDAASEDDSKGYALSKDPPLHALQLNLREWAIHHDAEILRAMEFSSSADDRRLATEALGYATQSPEQIRALVHASRDPDGIVRNNATRALSVLASSSPQLASQIPPELFIEMLNSGRWLDRNKATWLLYELTSTRRPELLAKLRAEALDSLIEMASWRRSGHAFAPRMVLGRVAGLPEERLLQLANDRADEIVKAATQHGTSPR